MNADQASAHEQHQKDFMHSFFQPDHSEQDQHQRGHPEIYHTHGNNMSSSSAPPHHNSIMHVPMQQSNSMSYPQMGGPDMLENLMAMQDRSGQSAAGMGQVQAAALLEQQMRLSQLQLQQLQQLSNQILQQQIDLLSGQSNLNGIPNAGDRPRDQQQYGLLTPGPSNELQAQQNTDFVSPMLLHPRNNAMSPVSAAMQTSNLLPQHMIPSAPHSAPANIVFQTTPSYPLPSPAELDFGEISPLTSPWLGAYNNGNNNGQMNQPPPPTGMQNLQVNTGSGSNKRRASPQSGDEMSNLGQPLRKRSTTRIAPGVPALQRKQTRSTRSANSTPLFPPSSSSTTARPSPSRRIGSSPGDSPSPVDLSMPPPAPPPVAAGVPNNNSGPHDSQHIMPVTPASIMNLGRLGTNSALAPPGGSAPVPKGAAGPQENAAKAKPTGRTRSSTLSRLSAANSSNVPLVSPSLKPIRPAGNAAAGETASPTVGTPQQPVAVRKTSHKAAEQKRRDSLKTSFDDLRLLLPPIPLPSDEGYPDEPVLPGAMPPRGPPKGNVDGPNRGVSKLQLLRCGNEFIRLLQGRVERRDEEIHKLRQEVRRLASMTAGMESRVEGDGMTGEAIDLEKDLDAVEVAFGGLLYRATGMNGSIAEGDEGDEDGE